MKRREFLQSLAGITLLGVLPSMGMARTVPAWRRSLILIELQGGNDGLNTVIPYRDPGYRALRPRLAIAHDRLVALSDGIALHPSLAGLQRVFGAHELAIVQGMGYPEPNRSHFRSIDIWETASGSRRILDKGWVADLLDHQQLPESLMTGALVFGRDPGPVRNARAPSLVLSGGARVLSQHHDSRMRHSVSANPALRHILTVERQTEKAMDKLARSLRQGRQLRTRFPRTPLGRQLEIVARLMINDIRVPVIKLGMGGFDTHSNQPGRHARLLRQFNDAVMAFREAMRATGRWNDILMMTYSEFGRRARENGSRGTDHGTSAPHFVIGGQVRGGLYGRYPSLARLENGDLTWHVDYRSLYHTISRDWLGMAIPPNLRRFTPIRGLLRPL